MNVNEVLERLQNYILGEFAAAAGIDDHIVMQNTMAVFAAVIVVGLLFGFLGWKMVRVWAALTGLVIGFALGIMVSAMAGAGGTVMLIGGAAAGIVLAVLASWLYRMGVFLITFFSVYSLCVRTMDPQNWILLAVCLAIALAAAILSVRFAAVITIFVTGICGAAAAGTAIYELLPVKGGMILLVICFVLAAGGISVQLLLESKKQKKINLKRAQQIREENSTANDVERARAMMEEFDKNPDDSAEEE